MSNKNIGIKDVAVAAGVSVTTVSHVLNELPTPEWARERGNASMKRPNGWDTGPTGSPRPCAPNAPG